MARWCTWLTVVVVLCLVVVPACKNGSAPAGGDEQMKMEAPGGSATKQAEGSAAKVEADAGTAADTATKTLKTAEGMTADTAAGVSAIGEEKIAATTAKVAESVAPIQKEAGGSTAAVTEAIPEKTAAVTESTPMAIEETAEAVGEKSDILGPAVAVDTLKEDVGGFSVEKLTALAGELKGAIEGKEEAITGLRAKITEAATGLAGGNIAELKSQLESAVGDLGGLKEKLNVVVSALAGKGADVSAFKGLLGQ